MSAGRNIQRGSIMPRILPFAIFFGIPLVFIAIMYAILHQRKDESLQRVQAMHAEITRIETALVSLDAQQAAMLTPESLKLRLQSKGTALVKIPARSHVTIEYSRGTGTGVAMESGGGGQGQ